MNKRLTITGCGLAVTGILLGVIAFAQEKPPVATKHAPSSTPSQQSVRVAVIGGMFETGFWEALATKYEKETGVHIELKAAGPKDQLDKAFKQQGGIDLITMHASDTIINLVADGYATDPQPWMRNDLIIVGPPDDPAGIKGMTDAAAAFKKIADTKAPFVVHSSLGAQEVMRNITDRNNIAFDPATLTQLFADNSRSVLKIAKQKHAYTLVGRIPFRTGKLPNDGLVLMVSGDERLRRPYVVAVANPEKIPDARVVEAKRFSAYVRTPETQAWIAEFGRGKIDDQPLFLPVYVPPTPATPPPGVLSVTGSSVTSLALSQADLKTMPRHTLNVKDQDGHPTIYEGVLLRDVLLKAGLPLGQHRLKGPLLGQAVFVTSSDGYRVAFGLAEFDGEYAEREILLADHRDGALLGPKEGPFRLVVPQEARHGRWARMITSVTVNKADSN